MRLRVAGYLYVRDYLMIALRIFAAVVSLVAIALAVWGVERTGDFSLPLVVVTAVVFYWVIECQAQRGTVLYALQYVLIRSLIVLMVAGCGVVAVYLSFSELSAPVVFRSAVANTVCNGIRALAGSVGMAAVFSAAGIGLILKGIRMFPVAKSEPKK